MSKRKFPMGQLVATLAVIELMQKEGIKLEELFALHVSGNWGSAVRLRVQTMSLPLSAVVGWCRSTRRPVGASGS